MAEQNPRVSVLLRGVSLVELGVLGLSGAGLFVFPQVFRPLWPWDIAPFNAAFVGAIYLASVPAIAAMGLHGGWSPSRVVVAMLLAFTGIGLAASLLNFGQFHFGRWTTWVWFLIFTVLPLNSAFHLWRYRQWPQAQAHPNATWVRLMLRAMAVGLAACGLAQLLAPEFSSGFWPWAVDAFHGRLYSGAFVAGGVGAWLTARSASRAELTQYALNMLLFGLLSLLGVIGVDLAVRRVEWAAPGVWVWVAGFGALMGLGLALLAYTVHLSLQKGSAGRA